MNKHQRPTIFDLADYIGVSRGTISRAFNNQAGISVKTRDKVLRAAREIGYTPHNGARLMKLRRKRRWGILLPYLHNPYYAELVEALSHEAHTRGMTILLGLSANDRDREEEIIGQWTSGETDGLILDQAHYHANPDLFHQLKERGVTMLFLHGQHGQPIPDFDFIDYDFSNNFSRLLKHLDGLGHTRIGYVAQDFPLCRNTSRFLAYQEFHRSRSRPLDESLIYFGGEDAAQSGINAWKSWLESGNRPTAVVCCDDIIACGIIHAVRSSGYRVPYNLSVAGVDDIAEAARLELTTIRLSREFTARTIFDQLESRQADPDAPPRIRTIPSILVLRESIGRPPVENS